MTRFLSILAAGLALTLLMGQDTCQGDQDADGDGWTTGDGDCNDADATVHPGAEELVDGLDNDCDGAGRDGTYEATASTSLSAADYEYSTFRIASDVSVTVTGSSHLRLYVLGDVTLDGTLDLSGQDGESAISGGKDVPRQAGGAGGGGGGYAGGSGGYYTECDCAADYNGENGGGPGGGYAADIGHSYVGGSGGGAGHATEGDDGATGTCGADRCGSSMTFAGGEGGAAYGSADLSDADGGSGGAGGGYGHGDNGLGGGGGGGGGVVRIDAATISVSGALLANGGAGGSETDGSDGGPGGGGSGGGIWLSADSVSITGRVEALGGAGGTSVVGGSSGYPGAGGAGSDGFIRIDATDITGTTSPEAYLGERGLLLGTHSDPVMDTL